MSNDELIFTQIIKKHQETIYSVCLMYAADQDEANDLMQEALINLWKGYQGFRGESDVKTWIWRVTMNTCISQDRKKTRSQEIRAQVGDLLTPISEDNKQIARLHARIRRLQPFDRAIVMLWLEDMSYEEIGQVLGISTKNVSVRLVRIKEELKKMND